MGAECTAAFSNFKFPNLKAKNTYQFPLAHNNIDQAKFNELARKIFSNNTQLINSYRNLLAHFVSSQQNSKFKDPNFQIEGQHLSKLYDYKKKSIKLFTPQNKSGLSLFQQQDVQLAYLSTVMFFLSQNKDFLTSRILLNEEINFDTQIYGFRLFCNGQQHNVIVDDIVPATHNNDLKYCVLKEKQLWPALLQKAWCKMIGSYDKAMGLSPEQCFQEITGLPASSVKISSLPQENIYSQLVRHQNEGHWLSVVAYQGTEILKSGQVFVIQKIDDQNICLASPYTNFHQSLKDNSNVGYLKVPFHKFRSLFEYLVIGYAKKGYVPISKKVKCSKRQQKLYEIDVKEMEDISIRFTQFFNGYLNDSDKTNYDYSALVSFELYDNKGIYHFCQGCDRLYSGAHSVYFTKSIFHTLNKGVYYLRVQVDWEHPTLIDQGNIVIYASQDNVQIEEATEQCKIMQLHRKTLQQPKSVVINNEKDDKNNEYELRFVDKKTGLLVSIQNKVQSLLSLQLNFSTSHNFRVKYGALQKNKTVKVHLSPKEIKILQILPQEVKHEFKLEPFTVKKLPNPKA